MASGMKILVIGSGAREHALVWRLAQEADVICAPGNPGIEAEVPCFPIAATDTASLIGLAREHRIDLVVYGPEDPLVLGGADAFREAGFAVFGPGAAGAQLEGSKAFSKEFMVSAGIPTATHESFVDAQTAKEYARIRFADGCGVVVKASGNALGKGVIVCEDIFEAEDAIHRIMIDKVFGEAGSEIVIEDRLEGREFSLFTLISDAYVSSMPVARDYKRIGTGDTGPNTGGMGSFSPDPSITPELLEEVEERIIRPTVVELHRRGIAYRGNLFTGVMLHHGRPHCLEFNVRFGDPETQSLMARISGGFAAALYAAAVGEAIPPVQYSDDAAVTVVLASAGYPGDYARGKPITLSPVDGNVKRFHAGTKLVDGQLVTSGGRVMSVTATGPTIASAREAAYRATESVQFEGMQLRSDIAELS